MNRTISILKFSKKKTSETLLTTDNVVKVSGSQTFRSEALLTTDDVVRASGSVSSKEKLKRLSLSKKYNTAGRNNSGTITAFHRGGGSKRLFRKIDFKRALLSTGIVETVEYDPNRSSFLALVRWHNFDLNCTSEQLNSGPINFLSNNNLGCFKKTLNGRSKVILSYILACNELKIGQIVHNIVDATAQPSHNAKLNQSFLNHSLTEQKAVVSNSQNLIEPQSFSTAVLKPKLSKVIKPKNHFLETVPLNNVVNNNVVRIGNSMPLQHIPVGTLIHNIELNPNQGAKLVRAAGTFAQLVYVPTIAASTLETYEKKTPNNLTTNDLTTNDLTTNDLTTNDLTANDVGKPLVIRSLVVRSKSLGQYAEKCVIRLPSGVTKQLDMRCCATVGAVSNTSNGTTATKKTKAGQNRWLGRRPVVRGVAMNPVDHPHGGGEGRTKGGRPSVSPWGKLTKGGFKTSRKQR